MSKKDPETPDAETPSIIQPIIDDLKANAPPELPVDDAAPPPRGPIHPPQPTERGPNAGFEDDPVGD